jgi:hypothetical protein
MAGRGLVAVWGHSRRGHFSVKVNLACRDLDSPRPFLAADRDLYRVPAVRLMSENEMVAGFNVDVVEHTDEGGLTWSPLESGALQSD